MLSARWQARFTEPSHESKPEWLLSEAGGPPTVIDWLYVAVHHGAPLPATAIEANRTEEKSEWGPASGGSADRGHDTGRGEGRTEGGVWGEAWHFKAGGSDHCGQREPSDMPDPLRALSRS